MRSNIHWLEEKLAQAVLPTEDVPKPRFAAGQSVLQWWASWFKKEGPAPSHYSKKQRPTWFSGKIVSPGVYMVDLMYAGYHNVVIMVAQCISVAHEPPLLLLRPCLPRRVVFIVAHEPLCLGCFCPGCGLVASWMVFCVMLWGLVCGWCFLASWLR